MLNHGKSSEDFDIDIVSTKLPSQSEYLQQAKIADERMAKLLVEKHAHKIIYKTYNSGENVFVRTGKKEENSPKDMAGTVEKRYQDYTYLVKYKLLNSENSTKAKFRVEDISDFPKDKNVNAKENQKNKETKAYQESAYS